VCPNPECPEFAASGGEFRDDVAACPRCGRELVTATEASAGGRRHAAGEPGGGNAVELVELCVATDPNEAALIEGLLQGAGIHYLMTDPVDTGFGGWGRIIIGPGSFVGRARFVVAADDLDRARALVTPVDDAG
jgi:hypothetical protein